MEVPDESGSGISTRARILIALAVVAVVLVAGHVAYAPYNDFATLIVGIAGIAGFAIVASIPVVLGWFVWHFILRRLYRVRHIRQKEMERLFREAAARGAPKETGGQK